MCRLSRDESSVLVISILYFAVLLLITSTIPFDYGVTYSPKTGIVSDTGSYIKYAEMMMKGEIEFNSRIFRPLYPLLSIPFSPLGNQGYRVIPVISAVLFPLVIHKIMKLYFSKLTSFVVALLALFSQTYSYYGIAATPDSLSLLLGFSAFYLWLKKKPSSLLFALSLLAKETNLILALSALSFDFLKKKDLSWAKNLIVFLLLLTPLYVHTYFETYEYAEKRPDDDDSIFTNPAAVFTTLLRASGVLFFAAVFLLFDRSPFALIFLFNLLMQSTWGSIHPRYWSQGLISLLYLSAKYIPKRMKTPFYTLLLSEPYFGTFGFVLFKLLF